jgi:delta14-sterol reductase
MDITTDGFGFMLSFGDLCWVPFMYSLQARFLAFHPVHLGIYNTLVICALNVAGYWIFRASNGEKDSFRRKGNPKGYSIPAYGRDTRLTHRFQACSI